LAADPNPELSAQLAAARAVLAPQIRGLADLAATSVSTDLRVKLEEVRQARQRRDDLIASAEAARDAYIATLERLEDDGYPALPTIPVLGSLMNEITEENADLAAATAIFRDATAATMAIGLSAPVTKTE
jgi:hypothetical protein